MVAAQTAQRLEDAKKETQGQSYRSRTHGGKMKIITAMCKGDTYEIMVDDEDYPLLSRHRWYLLASTTGRLYAYTSLCEGDNKRRMMQMTHMIMGNSAYIDHIDNNSMNNQKTNLRVATHQQNGWNKGKPKRNANGECTSKYKGVSYRPIGGKDRWFAHFKYVAPGAHKSTGKIIKVGYFWDEDEAASAYNREIVKYRGERAWLNPVPAKGGSE